MLTTRKIKLFLIPSLIIILTMISFSPRILAGPADPFSKVQEKLEGISDEERDILQNLFVLVHDIEQMEGEEKALTREVETLNKEIEGLEAAIAGEENAYEEKRDVLKQVLNIYQRRGPGSYLEIILDSENLNMLLWRINTLQDLSRNTGGLLESLEKSKGKLDEKKAGLDEKLVSMEDKQKQLEESLDKKLQLKEDNVKYLATLGEQKGHYLDQLDNIQQVWSELKLLFSVASGEFLNIIKDGSLPPNAVNIAFTSRGIEGLIAEKTFNDIIAGNPLLFEMSFSFYPGRVEIRVPKKNLALTGTFEILEGNTIKFVAEKGSFYGMSLEPDTIGELFKDGLLVLNLKPLIGSSILNYVEITEGHLKLIIKPVF